MPTSGTSAASAGPGPGELSPFAENAWVHKQLQDALGREETGNDLAAIQQKEIHKLRKELELERRDLFDAGGGAGAGSKRKQPGPQPGVAKAVALEQVRVKYEKAWAQTHPHGQDPGVKDPTIKPNIRIQPEAKAGLLELANILAPASKRSRRSRSSSWRNLWISRWCIAAAGEVLPVSSRRSALGICVCIGAFPARVDNVDSSPRPGPAACGRHATGLHARRPLSVRVSVRVSR